MAPHPRRTITVLEAYPHSSTILDHHGHVESDDGMTGPSPAPQTARQTETNAASPSRRSTRRGVSSFSPTSAKSTSDLTVTSYSSTTTIYTTTSSTFATSTSASNRAEPSSTIAGPPIHRTHVNSPYNIPDAPAWFPFVIGILLAVMLSFAVLSYLVNFYPHGRTFSSRYHAWRARVAERKRAGMSRYGYERVDGDDDVEDDGESRTGTSPSLRETAEAVTTSANTPGLQNTPTLYSRRRKMGDMRLEEGGVAGLGITLDAGQKSFDETVLRPDMDKPLPPPPRSALHSARAYLSPKAIHSTAPTDLEAGLLKPPSHDRRRPTPPSPALPSPGLRVLEMVGGSVEYAAEKMSRFMHDSVKGDPEEGLLLPVRDCEREKMC